jgi:hypothetical protein
VAGNGSAHSRRRLKGRGRGDAAGQQSQAASAILRGPRAAPGLAWRGLSRQARRNAHLAVWRRRRGCSNCVRLALAVRVRAAALGAAAPCCRVVQAVALYKKLVAAAARREGHVRAGVREQHVLLAGPLLPEAAQEAAEELHGCAQAH